MISNHQKLRQMMAENGYEHTPDEAKELCDKFNIAIEKLTSYENYALFCNMDEQEIKEYVKGINKVASRGNKISVKEFKEIREFVLEICEGR
jgi:tRNA-dihydrouridine synthase